MVYWQVDRQAGTDNKKNLKHKNIQPEIKKQPGWTDKEQRMEKWEGADCDNVKCLN